MLKRITGACLLLTAVIAGASIAASSSNATIEKALRNILPGFQVDKISASPISGLSEVLVGPRLYYVTNDGKYLIQGNLIDLKNRVDVSEERRKGLRLDAVNAVGEQNMIIFPAKNERHTITVFTDIDCGYCRKLHKEIDKYNQKGITVRYLMYPRSGNNTPSYYKAVSVWCAADRRAALTQSKAGRELPRSDCKNPVLSHMELGKLIGVTGTPALVLDDGELLPGYVPATRLAKALDSST